jgi:hypothetical protein
MSFNPKLLPPAVYEAYLYGPIAWTYTIQTAIKLKITDINLLTNIAFFLHHPELGGRTIRKDEVKFISDWKAFRNLIAPLLTAPAATSPTTKPFIGGWGSSQYQYAFEGTYYNY